MRDCGYSYQCHDSVRLCDSRIVLTSMWSAVLGQFRQISLCQELILFRWCISYLIVALKSNSQLRKIGIEPYVSLCADRKVTICTLCFIEFVVCSMSNLVVYRTAKKVVFFWLFNLRWLKTVSSTRFWWVVIATLYHLLLQSWYQKTAQLLVSMLLSFS